MCSGKYIKGSNQQPLPDDRDEGSGDEASGEEGATIA
jgi:hypothetical protein